MRFVTFIIYAVIGTVPFVFAAVQPWVWSVYVAAIFIAFLFLLWTNRIFFDLKRGKIFLGTIVFFFSYILFQCMPFPPQLLKILSTYRHQLLEKSSLLTDIPVSWQAVSYSPMDSLSWWIFLLGLLMFFLILRVYLSSHRHIKTLILIMLIVGTIEAIYGIIQALVPSVGVLWVNSSYTGCARGTFICRNHFAGFLEMVWPLSLGYVLAQADWTSHEKHEKRRYSKRVFSSDKVHSYFLFSLAVALMLLSLLFSKSRAGIAGAGIGFLTFILLARFPNKRLPMFFWIIVGAVVGMLFVYGSKIGFDPIIERFLELREGISRIGLWQDGMVILKDHPLGIGLGNFKHVFPVYFTSGLSEVTVYSHVHNDYLQLLIEAGWPGFLALVSGFFIFLGTGVRKLIRLNPHDDPLRFFAATGALSGLISIAFHSFFDFNLQIPANCIYFVTLISLAYASLWGKPHGLNSA
jgi:O-antigen ligase